MRILTVGSDVRQSVNQLFGGLLCCWMLVVAEALFTTQVYFGLSAFPQQPQTVRPFLPSSGEAGSLKQSFCAASGSSCTQGAGSVKNLSGVRCRRRSSSAHTRLHWATGKHPVSVSRDACTKLTCCFTLPEEGQRMSSLLLKIPLEMSPTEMSHWNPAWLFNRPKISGGGGPKKRCAGGSRCQAGFHIASGDSGRTGTGRWHYGESVQGFMQIWGNARRWPSCQKRSEEMSKADGSIPTKHWLWNKQNSIWCLLLWEEYLCCDCSYPNCGVG